MNKFKETSSEAPIPEKTPRSSKPNKITRSIIHVISGGFLSKDNLLVHLPYILFLTFIGLAYIANGYYAEKSVREISRINGELKELKSEFITAKSDLMFMSNQSEIAKAVVPLGLKESTVPPHKIVIQVNTNQLKDNNN